MKIRNNPRQLQALTSLKPEEFEELLPVFRHRYEQKIKHFTMSGKRRGKPLGGRAMASNTRTLPTVLDKYLFILYHFKIDSIQFAEAAFFGLSQSQTSRWIHYLRPVLHAAIKDLHLHPARDIDELVRLFRHRQHRDSVIDKPRSETLHADATDREITRSVDHEAQKFDYSGKQKRHTVKNTVINDEFRFIHFIGPSHRGAVHDKRMIDTEIESFAHPVFAGQWLTKDTGYQGYLPVGINLLQPYKKKAGTELTAIQKEFNTWVAKVRAVSENAIGGMKILRRLRHRCRRFNLAVADLEVTIAAGLHNFRVTRRKTSYDSGRAHVRANLH